MLMTFSRAAAEELKTRIADKVPSARAMTAGTFHSIALSILKSYPAQWVAMHHFPRVPELVDDEKRDEILFNLARSSLDSFLGIPLSTIVWLCSPCSRKKGSSHGGFAHIEQALDLLLEKYAAYKEQNACVDFDDLIADCTRDAWRK